MEKQTHNPLSPREISAFCTQLAFVVRAGVPLQEGVSILAEDAEDSRTRALLDQIADRLYMGSPLAEALRAAEVFPSYMLAMVEIGQEAGRLEEVLESLADYYESNESIQHSIRSALAYPMTMIVMMAVVIGVLVVRVLTIFQQVLTQLGSELAITSQGIMGLGTVLSVTAIVVVALMLALLLAYGILRRFAGGRRALERFYAAFPLTRGVAAKTTAARFASAMALMLSSGLDVDKSLEMTGELLTSESAREKVRGMQSAIAEGGSFVEALEKAQIFSGIDTRMVAVGFKTGSADAVMKKIALRCENDVSVRIGSLISAIEPTLVAVLSIVVGVIILSVMMPLMGILSTIA